jgi:hypothetical protein
MVSQAQRDALEGPIKHWVHLHPSDQCGMLNGKRQLFDHVMRFMAGLGKDLKDKQVNAIVKRLLMKHRDGVIMPQCTPKSFVDDPT